MKIALALGAVLTVAALTTLPTQAVATQAVATQAVATQAVATSAGQVRVTNGCLTSVPDPGSTENVKICYTIFRPATASRHHQVPFIMHSHGWGGSRTTDPQGFQGFLDAGYGVLSFDQRGFGESGGHAYVENPEVEGHDVRKLVSLVSRLDRVKKDGPGDPRMGAIGGSYGGGYQFLGAFEELRLKGKPVFDALAPEITWYDLSQSLAPEDVVRTAWASALSAASTASDALPPNVYAALAEGAATGTWPDGSVPGEEDMPTFFRKNGPKWHVDHGRRLDIPVLFGQGTTDSLFPLQQGLANWKHAITDRARRHSIFVGYNGGHVLPAVVPPGIDVTSDPCSKQLAGGTFEQLSIRFFDEQLEGRDTGLHGYGRYHLATPDKHLHHGRLGRGGHDVRRRHRRDDRDRWRAALLQDRGRADPGRRYAVPHRHADGARRQQPRVLRPRGRYLGGRRPPGPEQRAPAERAGPGCRRGAPDRPPVGGGGRARGAVAVRAGQPGQRHVRRHGQPYAGCDSAGQHGGPPPHCGAVICLTCRACPHESR